MEAPASDVDVRALRALPTPVADALLARGCRSAADVLSRPECLREALHELRLPESEAQSRAEAMLNACQRELANNTSQPAATGADKRRRSDAWGQSDSAFELLQRAQSRAPIVLPCSSIGRLLGSALRPGASLLEICGLPGAGKTQLCMQLCAAAQVPLLGRQVGMDGADLLEAVYIDTEGSFVAARYAQMCRALLEERRAAILEQGGPEVEAMLTEKLLRGLHVCRSYDAVELYSTVKRLGEFLKSRPKVRALVVDSVAFCFRHELTDNYQQRARLLIDLAATLRRLGAEYGIVVVLTNHMTTRFDRSGNTETSWLAPALGETWAHQPSTQLRLSRQTGLEPAARRAELTKSVEQAAGRSCLYEVSTDGIRDVATANAAPLTWPGAPEGGSAQTWPSTLERAGA